MNIRSQVYERDPAGASRWSIRILALALAGIFFLTLYPFHFAHAPAGISNPFLLGHSGKSFGLLDSFLNVLLFVPYGFGLAALIEKRRRPLATAAIAFVAGALLSYTIEFLQLYVPERDSGWNDVFTNSTGALIGAVLCQICGPAVLRFVRSSETSVEAFATRRNATIVLLLYFAAWFAAAAHLQREARLDNWSSNAILLVGNEPPIRHWSPWKGEVYQLEFWARGLPSSLALQLTAPGNERRQNSTALAAYDFSGSPPFADQERHLPALDWISIGTSAADPPGQWNGAAWAATRDPVSSLVTEILKARQFSVRLRCAPSQIIGVSAAIVALSQPNGDVNMEVWQKNDTLELWFQTPLTSSTSFLSWNAPKVFAANQTRDVLFSYDGSNLSVAIDGKPVAKGYHLGPGPALATLVRGIKSAELEGYRYIFYSLVFFPAGSFLAVGWREHPQRVMSHFPIALPCFLLAPILLEILLVRIGGQSISVENIGLGFAAMCLGAIWINLGMFLRRPFQTTSQRGLG